MMNKPNYYVVSLSGGKDSTAMLLGMIERGMQIDCILFCDTGLEFPAMYDHLDKLEKNIKRPITRVKPEHPFEYLMFETPVHRKTDNIITQKYGQIHKGYGWAGPRMRWCTTMLKDKPREQFLRPLRDKYTVIEVVGIAADEQYRMNRPRNKRANHIHPLVDWGMSEADCLQYCYDHGYDWDGLYEHFRRASCWCCPLQSLSQLRNLYQFYPELWSKLKEWDERTWRKFRADFNVKELEIRFKLEKQRLADGLSINGRAFFDALKKELEVQTDEQTDARQPV